MGAKDAAPRKRALSAARRLSRAPLSGTYRIAAALATHDARDQRAGIAARLRAIAEELEALGTDDARLAADLLEAIAFPVEHLEDETLGADRAAYVEAMVASLNALAGRWKPERRWWLGVGERERLAAAEAERLEFARRGVYR